MCIGLHVNLHNEINVQKMFVKLTLGIDFTRLCVQSEQLFLYCRHKIWISSTLDAQKVKSKILGEFVSFHENIFLSFAERQNKTAMILKLPLNKKALQKC